MRIADWVRPTRQVGQINGQTVTDSITHPVDTYVRPYAYRDRSLQTITEALDRWSPTFTNLAVQARDQKFKKDVAEGMALMNELTAKGIDPLDVRMPEIREMVKNGLGGKLVQLNRAHEHGINIVQMETAAKGLQGAADDWFKNATFEKDGVQYHVYEMNDPVQFEKAFREFAAKRWFDITGGQYDARLFNEKYGPTMNEVRQNLEKQYISYKGKMKAMRAQQIYTASLDAGISQKLKNGTYLSDPQFTDKLASEMNAAFVKMSMDVDEEHAIKMLKTYFSSLMIGATGSQLDAIHQALEKVPMLWTSAERDDLLATERRERYYWEGEQSRLQRDAEREEQKYKREQATLKLNSAVRQGYDFNTPEGQRKIKEAIDNGEDVETVFKAARMNSNLSKAEVKERTELYKRGLLPPKQVRELGLAPHLEREAINYYNKNVAKYIIDAKKDPAVSAALATAGLLKRKGIMGTYEPDEAQGNAYSTFNDAFRLAQAKEIARIGLDKFEDDPETAKAELNRFRRSFVMNPTELATGEKSSSKDITSANIQTVIQREIRRNIGIKEDQTTKNLKAALVAGRELEQLLKNPSFGKMTQDFMDILTTVPEAAGMTLEELVDKKLYSYPITIKAIRTYLATHDIEVAENRIWSPEQLFEILKASLMKENN